MKISKGSSVMLKSFLGMLQPEQETSSNENYWKLIGEKGEVIDDKIYPGNRVSVLFEKKYR